jgi:hypothetical protein
MTPEEYLQKIIQAQTLGDDSQELKLLRERRDEVEEHLREEFGSSPTIRYGGSHAKGTLIKDSYDLDIICYFPRDDDEPGESLELIYNTVRDALNKHCFVEQKTSALRIKGADRVDFHVDVVPGRYVDADSTDVFLYQSRADKCRLKTNIDVHIAHVRESGVKDAIKLMKLWRTRHGVSLKTFVLELAVIDVLGGSDAPLDEQLRTVLEKLRDEPENINVKDPANPTGNDLSELWNDNVRGAVSAIARATLVLVDTSGWEAVFGKLSETKSLESKVSSLRSAAKSVSAPTRPWRRG